MGRMATSGRRKTDRTQRLLTRELIEHFRVCLLSCGQRAFPGSMVARVTMRAVRIHALGSAGA